MNDIRIFDLKYEDSEVEEFLDSCRTILNTAHLTNHDFVQKFEIAFSKNIGLPYSVAVSNGSSALLGILLAKNIAGKEVILPDNIFISDWLAIMLAGGIPVLVDIEANFLGPSLEGIINKISSKTAAIITLHNGGIISPEIFELQKICADRKIDLIEDCAHAFGSSIEGSVAGSFGLASAFSFHTTKVATTGEGGMACTNNREFREALVSVRQFGKSAGNMHQFDRLGWNLKMTEFQAALGLVELDRAEKRIRKRQMIAGIYRKRLENSSWKILLPPKNSICSYYKTIVMSPLPREVVKDCLGKNGISLTNGIYFTPLHKQEIVISSGENDQYPVSNHFSLNHFCPPCYPELESDSVHRICDELLKLAK